MLVRAEQEASQLGHGWAGTEHLLLAVISANDSTLSDMLSRHGIRHDKVATAIVELLDSKTGM